MRKHVVVFADGGFSTSDIKSFVDSLESEAEMLAVDNRVGILRTNYTATEVSGRLQKLAGSHLFFVADISDSEWSGRMYGSFLDFIKKSDLSTAAE